VGVAAQGLRLADEVDRLRAMVQAHPPDKLPPDAQSGQLLHKDLKEAIAFFVSLQIYYK